MSEEFKIESGIPMPGHKSGPRARKYPWKDMKVGDSFFVPNKRAGVMSSACIAAQKYGRGTFRARTVEGGCRVWRVE